MSWMFYLVDVFSVALEALIIGTFFGALCERRYLKKRVHFFIYFVFILVMSIVYIFVESALLKMLMLFFSIILLTLLYDLGRMQQVLGTIILFVFMSLCEILVGFISSIILNLTVGTVLVSLTNYTVGMLVSKLIAFVAVKIFAFKFRSEELKEKENNLLLTMFVVYPLVTFFIGIVLIGGFGREIETGLSIVSAVAIMILIGANVLVFYLFERYAKQLTFQHRMDMDNKKLARDRAYLQDLIDKQTDSNKTMHDLKNQLFAIQELVKNNDKKGLSKIDEICEIVLSRQSIEYTKNHSIDALVNSKKQMMEQNGIKFVCHAFFSDFGKIEEMDLCVLLGNLIDNAIEANQKITNKQRDLKLAFTQCRNYLNIEIENAIEENEVGENARKGTTKKDKILHGFGLSSVKTIAEKYNGSLNITHTKERFRVSVMLGLF